MVEPESKDGSNENIVSDVLSSTDPRFLGQTQAKLGGSCSLVHLLLLDVFSKCHA